MKKFACIFFAPALFLLSFSVAFAANYYNFSVTYPGFDKKSPLGILVNGTQVGKFIVYQERQVSRDEQIGEVDAGSQTQNFNNILGSPIYGKFYMDAPAQTVTESVKSLVSNPLPELQNASVTITCSGDSDIYYRGITLVDSSGLGKKPNINVQTYINQSLTEQFTNALVTEVGYKNFPWGKDLNKSTFWVVLSNLQVAYGPSSAQVTFYCTFNISST